MNIDLLSKMVAELILDNDEVSLPGLGVFVAEMVPASFSDKGYTINPPYRRLSFRQKQENDTLLVDLYADSNRLAPKDAASILGKFLGELKENLIEKKTVVFPGLGRLRATRENNFFFVPDENLNIYPEGFWMKSLSLKTHEETAEEIASAVESLGDMLAAASAVVAPSEPVSAPSEPVTEPEIKSVPSPEPELPEPVQTVEEVPSEEDSIVSEPVQAVEVKPSEEVKAQESIIPEPAIPESTIPESVKVEPVKEEPVKPEPVKPEPVKAEPVKPEPRPEKIRKPMPQWARTAIAATLATIGTVAAALILFVAVSRVSPGSTDKLLYTAEELEILNYPLD